MISKRTQKIIRSRCFANKAAYLNSILTRRKFGHQEMGCMLLWHLRMLIHLWILLRNAQKNTLHRCLLSKKYLAGLFACRILGWMMIRPKLYRPTLLITTTRLELSYYRETVLKTLVLLRSYSVWKIRKSKKYHFTATRSVFKRLLLWKTY